MYLISILHNFIGIYHKIWYAVDVCINGGKVAYFSSYPIARGCNGRNGTPFKKFKQALFVTALIVPTKELPINSPFLSVEIELRIPKI